MLLSFHDISIMNFARTIRGWMRVMPFIKRDRTPEFTRSRSIGSSIKNLPKFSAGPDIYVIIITKTASEKQACLRGAFRTVCFFIFNHDGFLQEPIKLSLVTTRLRTMTVS